MPPAKHCCGVPMASRAEPKPNWVLSPACVTQESNICSAFLIAQYHGLPSPRGSFSSSYKAQLKNCFFHESFLHGTSVPTSCTLPQSWSSHQGVCSPRLVTWSKSSPAMFEPFWIHSGTELVLKNDGQERGEKHLKTHPREGHKGWDQRPRPTPTGAVPLIAHHPSLVPPSQCGNQRSCRGWRWGKSKHSPPIPGPLPQTPRKQSCQPHVTQLSFQCGLTSEPSGSFPTIILR